MTQRLLGNIGTTLGLENHHVRVWDLDLGPGAISDVHRHDLRLPDRADPAAYRFEPMTGWERRADHPSQPAWL